MVIRVRCPRCGGMLYKDYDGYEFYWTCLGCARSFDLGMKPIQQAIGDSRFYSIIRLDKVNQDMV